ncbi:MAG: hypothetical protein R2880_01480 [Deinococcales bacterium]
MRLALIALAVVITVLIGLSFLPENSSTNPDTTIHLQEARLSLYPEADPDAIWHFDVAKVDYQPESREADLYEVTNGARMLGEEVDFTLVADKINIDQQDNLHGDTIFVQLVKEGDWNLDMYAHKNRQVLIDQNRGKFEVPLLLYRGSGIEESRAENVRMNFDLTEFESGGPDTENYDRFIDEVPQ